MPEEGDPIANTRVAVPDPGTVAIRFRFFNDSGDITDAEAFSSENDVVYAPVANLPGVEPYTVREAPPGQFPPADNPRHFSVLIRRNGMPVGTVHVGPSVADLEEAEATFHVDPATQDVFVHLWARDINGNVILPA